MIVVLELSTVGAISCAFLRSSHRWLGRAATALCMRVIQFRSLVVCGTTRSMLSAHFWIQAVQRLSLWLCDTSHATLLSANTSICTLTGVSSSPLREFMSFLCNGRANHMTVSSVLEEGLQQSQVCECVCVCGAGGRQVMRVYCLSSSVGVTC